MLEDMQKKPLASLCFSLNFIWWGIPSKIGQGWEDSVPSALWVVGFLLPGLLLLLSLWQAWRRWQQRPLRRKPPPLQGEQCVYSLGRSPFMWRKNEEEEEQKEHTFCKLAMYVYIYIYLYIILLSNESPGLHGNLQLVLFEDFLPPMGQPPVFWKHRPIIAEGIQQSRSSKKHPSSPRERLPKVAAHHPPALSGPKTAPAVHFFFEKNNPCCSSICTIPIVQPTSTMKKLWTGLRNHQNLLFFWWARSLCNQLHQKWGYVIYILCVYIYIYISAMNGIVYKGHWERETLFRYSPKVKEDLVSTVLEMPWIPHCLDL